jgi:hypothetical protein
MLLCSLLRLLTPCFPMLQIVEPWECFKNKWLGISPFLSNPSSFYEGGAQGLWRKRGIHQKGKKTRFKDIVLMFLLYIFDFKEEKHTYLYGLTILKKVATLTISFSLNYLRNDLMLTSLTKLSLTKLSLTKLSLNSNISSSRAPRGCI